MRFNRFNIKKYGVILLVILFWFFMFWGTNSLIEPKNQHIEGYKKQKDVDVCFYGSSHAYSNIEPNVLLEQYGISSYALACPEQPMSVTYHTMRNSFNLHKPKVAVVELFMVRTDLEDQYDLERKKNQFSNGVGAFPLSREKYDAAKEILGEELKWDGFFYFPMYHENYKKIFENKENEDGVLEQRGFQLVFDSMASKDMAIPEPETIYNTYTVGAWSEITDETRNTLEKIRDLCRDNDVQLLFLVTPYLVAEDEAAGYSRIWVWAQQEGISFLDMNNHVDEIGLSWNDDMYDPGHANYYGAAKNSAWLGAYLLENYALPDRRVDKN